MTPEDYWNGWKTIQKQVAWAFVPIYVMLFLILVVQIVGLFRK